MAHFRSFFTEAYERLLITATVAMIAIVALCYLWGITMLLAAVKGATATPPVAGSEQGFRAEEAERLLKTRGILP